MVCSFWLRLYIRTFCEQRKNYFRTFCDLFSGVWENGDEHGIAANMRAALSLLLSTSSPPLMWLDLVVHFPYGVSSSATQAGASGMVLVG
jgi:hypothetical protein